ncbi:MAG TPA: aminotransferase class IV [Symbiobacteriaceae bacterium]|nr:aminotransferase class IV [Symbiobacteriaceae bacterium]
MQDRGALYGDGLFETILVRENRAPLLPLHLARLKTSAAALAIPYDAERVTQAIAAHLAALPPGEHALRLTLSRGEAVTRGYAYTGQEQPTLYLTSTPYRRPFSPHGNAAPLRAITATNRVYSGSPLTRHKSLSALEKVIARTEAARAGVDEAILLNEAGRPVEGTSHNLFIHVHGEWMTPPVTEGCLPGVMRSQLLRLLGAREIPLTREAVRSAERVLLSNALLGALPLIEWDGEKLKGEGPMPLPFESLWTLP